MQIYKKESNDIQKNWIMTSYILSSVTKGEAENKRRASDVLYVCVCAQVSDRSPSQCSMVVRPFIIRGFIFYYHIMTGYDRAPPPSVTSHYVHTHTQHTHIRPVSHTYSYHSPILNKKVPCQQSNIPPPPQKKEWFDERQLLSMKTCQAYHRGHYTLR